MLFGGTSKRRLSSSFTSEGQTNVSAKYKPRPSPEYKRRQTDGGIHYVEQYSREANPNSYLP